MNLVNVIGKVRFSSAKAQRVQIHRGPLLQVDMFCLEPGQETTVRAGEWVWYVVTGSATLTSGGEPEVLQAGQMATADGGSPRAIRNTGEQRVVCLAFGLPSGR